MTARWVCPWCGKEFFGPHWNMDEWHTPDIVSMTMPGVGWCTREHHERWKALCRVGSRVHWSSGREDA